MLESNANRAATSRDIRTPFEDTKASLREYLTTVQGTVKRGKPETLAIAVKLLRPLLEWDRSAPPADADDKPIQPSAPITPATPTGSATPAAPSGTKHGGNDTGA